MIEGLITPEACVALAGLYPVDGIFRSRVVMGRHGFRHGELKAIVTRGFDGSRGEAGNVAIVDELGTPLANRLHRWCWPRSSYTSVRVIAGCHRLEVGKP